MKAPAFSLDYFPSRDVAWSLFRDNKTVVGGLTTPIGIRSAESWDYFDSRIGTTYGSTGSSNGPWAGDLLPLPSGPQTPYSTGNTPPAFPYLQTRSRHNSTINSLSTSPEQHQQRPNRRTNSNLSAAFASFSRPFANLSSSPGANDRFRSDADLSTSAPATAITWGSTTFYSGSSSLSPEKRRRASSKRSSFAAYDSTYSSSEGSYHHISDHSDDETSIDPLNKATKSPTVKVTLKNQHLFDEEGHASIPLLPPDHHEKYAAYRDIYANQLSIWGLYIQRAEVLKFNGLTSYWPAKVSDTEQQQQGVGNGFPIPRGNRPEAIERALSIVRPHNTTIDHSSLKWPEDYVKMAKTPGYIPSDDLTHRETAARVIAREERINTERNKLLEKPEVLAREQLSGEDALMTTERLRTTCRICKTRIMGIFVRCPSFIHEAHVECHRQTILNEHGYLRDGKDSSGMGIGCGCHGDAAVEEPGDGIAANGLDY
jgi:hypothetical protein